MKKVDVARRALEAYAVPVARIAPLKNVYNTTYRVVAKSGDRYVLRISHPRRTAVDVVRSELLWLAALRQDAGLHVPEPARNREAQYVTVLADATEPRPYLCALFHWTPGRFLSRTLSPGHLLRVGELMARLHDHATHWERPADFIRPRVENLNPLQQEQDDEFKEAIAALATQTVVSVSTPGHGAIVAAVIEKVWKVLQGLGEGPADFGLIHADVHQWNYLFHNGQVGVIDFDDCGYGHWLYDLAVTLYCLHDRPDFAALKDAFLSGYRRSRPFSVEQERRLEIFVALRRLQDLLWVIEERDRPAFRNRWQAVMLDQLQELRRFVNH
jgi:Ser/Thr protein kinase RdoA (MazF antagonist)